MQRLGVVFGAGLCGGAAAGAIEALMVLQSGLPLEYQAFGAAWTLYGCVGAVLGGALFVLVWPIVARIALPALGAAAFVLVFLTLSLGRVMGRHAFSWSIGTVAAVAAGVIIGIWLGGNMLGKTPLRILLTVRGWAAAWAGGAMLAWVFALSPPPLQSLPARPSSTGPLVVLLAVDALRLDAPPWLATGDSTAFSRLSADGVRFEQHVVASPSLGASVASLWTSSSPSTHACQERGANLSLSVTTLAEVLADKGLPTVGFPNSVAISPSRGFEQGFYQYHLRTSFPFGAKESTAELALFRALWHGGPRFGWGAAEAAEPFVAAGEQAESVLTAVDSLAGGGGFIFAQLSDLRAPFPSADPLARLLRGPVPASVETATLVRSRYDSAAASVDHAVETVVAGLQARGRYVDAAVIVVSLGGGALYDHGRLAIGGDLYDEQVHVPLIVKLPASRFAGARVPWQVREIDLAPTIADLAGAVSPPEWEGAELFGDSFETDLFPPVAEPLLDATGEVIEPLPVLTLGWQAHPASRDALMQEHWGAAEFQGLRRRGKKLVQALGRSKGTVEAQYFDVVADSAERTNLYGLGMDGEGEMKAALATMLEGRRARLVRRAGELDPAERAQLCAIGYFSRADCEGVALPAAASP